MQWEPLSDWLDAVPPDAETVNYRYTGTCPLTGQELSLPRTVLAESVAAVLMRRLGNTEGVKGRMYGVLLVETERGPAVLRAVSGLHWEEGWVPPIGGQPSHPLERETLQRLEELKSELMEVAASPARAAYQARLQFWGTERDLLNERHQLAKSLRDSQRGQVDHALLDRQSRAHSLERRLYKRARDQELMPLVRKVEVLDERVLQIKRERRRLSRALQAEFHAGLERSLFESAAWSLASLFPQGPPTGTGECCAPKLLHYAASRGWRPLTMAEFWWGPTSGHRNAGHFYSACAPRCQPLLGPLLSVQTTELAVLYQDQDLLFVDKPPGVLTVPGRLSWKQDCLLARLRVRFPELRAVHRLDMETSGVLVLALNASTQAALQRQFATRQVEKVYQARLAGLPLCEVGVLDHALGPHPSRPGCYRLDVEGKAARTHYRVIEREEQRVKLKPETGRSHQLRVHMSQGLGCPIRGDRLYGGPESSGRLLLHAWRLALRHPTTGQRLEVEAPLPF